MTNHASGFKYEFPGVMKVPSEFIEYLKSIGVPLEKTEIPLYDTKNIHGIVPMKEPLGLKFSLRMSEEERMRNAKN